MVREAAPNPGHGCGFYYPHRPTDVEFVDPVRCMDRYWMPYLIRFLARRT